MSKKKKALKQQIRRLKEIFEQEKNNILLYHDVEFHLSGFNSEIQVVFVQEDIYSPSELTFEMLKNFENRIKEEISSRWYVGISYTDMVAADLADYTDEY
tara:strand:- start:125 stop:424 length:300 start_codon:yes stop_codon:yes gene_type:complete